MKGMFCLSLLRIRFATLRLLRFVSPLSPCDWWEIQSAACDAYTRLAKLGGHIVEASTLHNSAA